MLLKQAQLSLPPKKRLGMPRDKHTKKLESNNYAATFPWKVLITRALKKIRQYLST